MESDSDGSMSSDAAPFEITGDRVVAVDMPRFDHARRSFLQRSSYHGPPSSYAREGSSAVGDDDEMLQHNQTHMWKMGMVSFVLLKPFSSRVARAYIHNIYIHTPRIGQDVSALFTSQTRVLTPRSLSLP